MPYYEYECSDCGNKFNIFRSIKAKAGNILCSRCESGNTHQVYSPPMTKIVGLPKDRFK